MYYGICRGGRFQSKRQPPCSLGYEYTGSILQNYYSACFSGKKYIPGSLIIKSIGIDQRTGGTHVTGLHSYQGQPVPFKGRKTHNDIQFKAVIIVQQNG